MGTRAAPTPDQVEAIRSGYAAGRSTYQLAADLGRSGSWVRAVMRQEGIARRRPGEQPGRRASVVGYDAQHWRVEQLYGTPKECWICGTTEDRRYEWANLTGNYNDPDDFSRMCVPCHRTYDAARRKAQTDGT